MSYPNYGYGVGYGTNPYYQGYQQPYQQNQFMNMNRQEQPMRNIEPTQQIRSVPFTEVLFGTYDQAKGQIVLPNMSMLFIDPDKNEAYIRKADGLGKQALETYKYSSLDNLPTDKEKPATELNSFVKKEELSEFLTKKDLNGFLTTEDLTEINEKLERLQKKLEINKLEKEIKK
jgi:hypothetical protein